MNKERTATADAAVRTGWHETVGKLLSAARRQLAASDSPAVDAETLLCHVLDKPRAFLFTWPEHQPTDEQARQFAELVSRRASGEPVAWLIGTRDFYGHRLLVSTDTLIPRADTELLVSTVLEKLPQQTLLHIADLGTGTGAIAIALGLARPHWQVLAADNSSAVLALAARNVQRLGADNVALRQSDWYSALDGHFDAIISNPPYIAEQDVHLTQGDVRFEPATALVAGADGLAAIRIIVADAGAHLHSGGLLAIEHGHDQGAAVRALFTDAGFVGVETRRDYGDNERVTLGYCAGAGNAQ